MNISIALVTDKGEHFATTFNLEIEGSNDAAIREQVEEFARRGVWYKDTFISPRTIRSITLAQPTKGENA